VASLVVVTFVLDEVVQLFDQVVSARESKAERRMRDALTERGRSVEDRQALPDDLLDIVFYLALVGTTVGVTSVSFPRSDGVSDGLPLRHIAPATGATVGQDQEPSEAELVHDGTTHVGCDALG
jgi:hypothetical protein